MDISEAEVAYLAFRSSIIYTSVTAEVLLSFDGGTTFEDEPIFSYSGGGLFYDDPGNAETAYNEYLFEIPGAAGHDDVAVAFHYANPGANAGWWAITDVRVTARLTGVPEGFRRGDTDGSGIVDISDPIFNLTFQFVGGIGSLPCEDAADVDDSGIIDISDPIYNLTFQFVGGIDPPPAPGPQSCDTDPTDDERTCESYPQDRC